MSETRAVVEVKWLLAAFPEAEFRNDVVWLNGSAFPVTILTECCIDHWRDDESWADDIQNT